MKNTHKIHLKTWGILFFIFFVNLKISTTFAQTDNLYNLGENIVNILKSQTPEKITELTKQDDIDAKASVLQSFLSVKDELSRIDDINNFKYFNTFNNEKSVFIILEKGNKFYIIRFHLSPENKLTGEFKLISGKLDNELSLGERIYKSKCFACHGKVGKGGIGPNLMDNYWKYVNNEDDVTTLITKGKKGTMMMAFENFLKPEEIKAVTTYIKALKNKKVSGAKKPEGDKKNITFHLFE